jgi:hypothetical protein
MACAKFLKLAVNRAHRVPVPLLAVVPNVAGLSTGRAFVVTGHSARMGPEIAVIAASNSHARLAALRGFDAGAVGWVRGAIIHTG